MFNELKTLKASGIRKSVTYHERDSGSEHRRGQGGDESDAGEKRYQEPLARLRKIEGHLGVILGFPTHNSVIEI
jgi:hypothetical protein